MEIRRDLSRQFTLLEIMIALGIMAIGLSAALGLFTAAAASGRRAEQLVEASHLADVVFADVDILLVGSFELDELEPLSLEQAEKLGFEALEEPGPEVDTMSDGEGPLDDGVEDRDPLGEGADDEPSTYDEPGEAAPSSGPRVLYAGESLPSYPDYLVWALISPFGDDERPHTFFCEVFVRWSEKGRKRGAEFRTVLMRRLSRLDIESGER
jgi:prepilin-type N-terminal cleavage/methylation domain-containing protein